MIFIKEELNDLLNFKPKDFEFFLDKINIGDDSKEQIRTILAETKRLPAALGGYHGDYEGGLHDHILLVTNLVHQICNKADFLKQYANWLKDDNIDISEDYDEINLPKAIQTAIYHDFGKISYYGFKLGLKSRIIYTNKVQRQEASSEILKKFSYIGQDYHVDECIAVLRRYNLPFDDDMHQAIIFHHGKWARYQPFDPTKLSELIHIADMISSHLYEI